MGYSFVQVNDFTPNAGAWIPFGNVIGHPQTGNSFELSGPIHALVKRMRRRSRQILRCNPHRRLTLTAFTFSHCHVLHCTTRAVFWPMINSTFHYKLLTKHPDFHHDLLAAAGKGS